MVEVCSREAAAFKNISGSAYDCFHNMLHGRSIVYIYNIIIANVKTLDIYCKERETLTDFSFAFQARALQLIFFKVIEIFSWIFLSFLQQ